MRDWLRREFTAGVNFLSMVAGAILAAFLLVGVAWILGFAAGLFGGAFRMGARAAFAFWAWIS